jgi:hypothetical protein
VCMLARARACMRGGEGQRDQPMVVRGRVGLVAIAVSICKVAALQCRAVIAQASVARRLTLNERIYPRTHRYMIVRSLSMATTSSLQRTFAPSGREACFVKSNENRAAWPRD